MSLRVPLTASMVPLLPLLLCCCAGRERSDVADDAAWARARIAALEAQLQVQQQRAERAEAQLALINSGDEVADDAAPPAMSSCAAAPYDRMIAVLPNGSYTKSCTSCVRWEQSVQCRCFSRDAVRPGMPLAAGNLTGFWSVATTAVGPGARRQGALPVAIPSGMVVRVDMASDAAHFSVRCAQAAQYEHGSAGSCAVFGPPASHEQWHTGHGVVHLVNHSVTLAFDNGQWIAGTVGNGTIRWKKPTLNSSTQLIWTRQNATAIQTALSLASCRGAQQLVNDDGHLSCDWKLVPPPRVGRIVAGKSEYGRLSVEESCRFVDHITFVAPQYALLPFFSGALTDFALEFCASLNADQDD